MTSSQNTARRTPARPRPGLEGLERTLEREPQVGIHDPARSVARHLGDQVIAEPQHGGWGHPDELVERRELALERAREEQGLALTRLER